MYPCDAVDKVFHLMLHSSRIKEPRATRFVEMKVQIVQLQILEFEVARCSELSGCVAGN